MSKKEALGKGIRALLENIDHDDEVSKKDFDGALMGAVNTISIHKIEVNPFQPRADFDHDKLQELANSIKVHGVVQPITVRKLDNRKFQLISGERRLRASKMAGLTEVPAYVRTANDQEMLEIALIENIQRENLNAIEIAINYKRLMDECSLTQESLSNRIGKERSTVTNYLRLLKLPPEIQKGIKEKQISMGHARALIAIDDFVIQLAIFKEILQKRLSVRQTEDAVRKLSQKKDQKKTVEAIPAEYRKVQDKLTSYFSTKVNVKHKNNGKGEIVINYYSDEDLNRILELLDNE